MSEKAFNVKLCSRRQITLPKEVCEQLGIKTGDSVEISLDGDTLVARPRKRIALEALREIQEAFRRSGITEEELQETGRKVRKGPSGIL